ncbi:hypothetical protein CROQUDRAFT_91882 [Cronartium quercuum f. sp. fusiforme G11]|uniref:Uncharacterized protein n=1 Tax=Cronartium quercuum f. sp. fusiforme G11 TaxID=708437 RepID=A0A9P6NK47_9BASI|nr:hypothetical protein CROQUDRAFT_91882 [Cronartium quercuum f. sp. fusiforme G11]
MLEALRSEIAWTSLRDMKRRRIFQVIGHLINVLFSQFIQPYARLMTHHTESNPNDSKAYHDISTSLFASRTMLFTPPNCFFAHSSLAKFIRIRITPISFIWLITVPLQYPYMPLINEISI